MSHFDACEACGQTELIVIDGLCFECQEKAERSARGKAAMPRASGLVMEEGRVRTYLAPRRPMEERERIRYAIPSDSPESRDQRETLLGRIQARVRAIR